MSSISAARHQGVGSRTPSTFDRHGCRPDSDVCPPLGGPSAAGVGALRSGARADQRFRRDRAIANYAPISSTSNESTYCRSTRWAGTSGISSEFRTPSRTSGPLKTTWSSGRAPYFARRVFRLTDLIVRSLTSQSKRSASRACGLAEAAARLQAAEIFPLAPNILGFFTAVTRKPSHSIQRNHRIRPFQSGSREPPSHGDQLQSGIAFARKNQHEYLGIGGNHGNCD